MFVVGYDEMSVHGTEIIFVKVTINLLIVDTHTHVSYYFTHTYK